ncbi:MAG: beta-lactamase family protein [Bifidobacteriaceae bacterium]|jgi:CubicO group peptidase (beta-lactamase class C family)|nr:beta-lactamase family protein [Bifidobacteriaceae bacterium]
MATSLAPSLAGLAQAEGIPGLLLATRAGDDFAVAATGAADLATGRGLDADTIFPIGSCSKAFIAAAVAILVDDAAIGYDDPVAELVPGFELATPELTAGLRVRDMLSHNSGLARHDAIFEVQPAGLDARGLVRRLRLMAPVAPLRYRMSYQNHMYVLASVLVSEVAGEPWDQFLARRVLGPAGMRRTFARLEDFAGDPNVAFPYGPRAGGEPARLAFDDVYALAGAAGCMASTARDMDRWLRLQLGRGQIEGRRIFSEAAAAALHSPQTIIRPGEFFPFEAPELDFRSYGLGWTIQTMHGRKLVAHGGAIRGFRTLAGFAPEAEAAFFIAGNLDRMTIHEPLGLEVAARLLGWEEDDWLGKLGAIMAPAAAAAAASEAEFWAGAAGAAPAHPEAAYTGRYSSELYGQAEIRRGPGGLEAAMGQVRLELRPVGGDAFASVLPSGLRCPLAFEVAAGRATSFEWNPDTPVRFTR